MSSQWYRQLVIHQWAHPRVCFPILFLYRYDNLSDGLDDVIIDDHMQTTLEDEEAIDAIDDIWQDMKNDETEYNNNNRNKISKKKAPMTQKFCDYEPLNNICDIDDKT